MPTDVRPTYGVAPLGKDFYNSDKSIGLQSDGNSISAYKNI